MCGIFSVYSKKETGFKSFFRSLKELEYRGYDSAGISYLYKNNFVTFKTTKKIKTLEKKVKSDVKSPLIMGHTRWATHGNPTLKNCHPHSCNKILLVHNGIVENFQELKKSNYLKNRKFNTETDSEVIVQLVDYFYSRNNDLARSVFEVGKILKGSNAFLCVDKNNPETLIAYKNKTPLFFGIKKNNEMIFSSDTNAMKINLDKYYFLKNEEILEINNNGFQCFNSSFYKSRINFTKNYDDLDQAVNPEYQNKSITYQEIISQRDLIPKLLRKNKNLFH